MDRRNLIKAAALAGIPAAVDAHAASAPMKSNAPLGAMLPAGPSPAEILRKAPPVDLDRAREIMERDGLQGLVHDGRRPRVERLPRDLHGPVFSVSVAGS